MEVYPSLAFDSLFENRGSKRTQSILDRVKDDAASLSRKISSEDSRKLDEFLTSVREVEKRVDRMRGDQTKAEENARDRGKPLLAMNRPRQRFARRHPRSHAANVRHCCSRFSDRQKPRGHAGAVPRSVRAVLSLPWRSQGPSFRASVMPIRAWLIFRAGQILVARVIR
jgi:hypothetical protein